MERVALRLRLMAEKGDPGNNSCSDYGAVRASPVSTQLLDKFIALNVLC